MNDFAERVCNQMLKGIGNRGNAEVQLPVECRTKFYEKFEALALEITKCMPGSPDGTYSAALGAVACKCAIKYGADKAKEFLSAMKNCTFQGQDDPAHLLWKFLNHPGPSFPTFYNKAVCAARAHCEGRKSISELRNVKKDIFEWNDDYTGPAISLRAQVKAAKEAGLPRPWSKKIKSNSVKAIITLQPEPSNTMVGVLKSKNEEAAIMADFLTSDAMTMAVAAAHRWKALHSIKDQAENQKSSDVEVNNSTNGSAIHSL